MADDRERILAAARRYGSDPSFDSWARKKYKVSGAALLAKVAKGEGGFSAHLGSRGGGVSSAGAKGWTQFMPATRADFIRKYGVDAWASPESAIKATKLYLEHDSRGLAGYNPGMPSYTNYILGQRVGDLDGGRRSGGGGGRGLVRGSAPSGGRPASTRTTIETTPGVDNRLARSALVQSFLEDDNSDVLDFAVQAKALADVPATSTRRTVRTPGAPATAGRAAGASSSGSAANFGAGRGAAGRRSPVAHMTSEGGAHPTAGLAGYPARDYFARPGTAAVAPVNGRVVRLSGHNPAQGPTQGPHGPLGYSVYIQGDDGHSYFLTHMGSRNVRPGQRVRSGQKIGTVANYDKYGTPSHIHMGVR